MNKGILYVLLFGMGVSTILNAEGLSDRYRQKMGIEVSKSEHTVKNTSYNVQKTEDDILGDIRKIKNMRQGTFEASKDFEAKRNNKILELKNKIKFFARTGEKKFSFGTVKMKSYDADQEKMQLVVAWHKEVFQLFPELKKVRTAYLNIPRTEAKELFEKTKRHYFHTDIGYRDERLVVTNMLLYDKYRFYSNAKRKPVSYAVAVKRNTEDSSVNNSGCSYYYCNASSVNVRSKPSAKGEKLDKLNRNKRVCVAKQYNSWSYIQNSGWVASRFLQKKRVKKVTQVKRRDKTVWHCTARSGRFSGWVKSAGKENAKRGALRQCTIRLQTKVPCKITNCYRL
ncbi:MAG: SH3 domain-containing protein [Campylobacterota bacterium]|nr:SH3 domain-containing protein [Campylobacterota bacterium]